MLEVPRRFYPSLIMGVTFGILILIFLIALGFYVAWSASCNVRGIEVWTYILTSSISFLGGILIGLIAANAGHYESPNRRRKTMKRRQ